jgi:hypothetical protein
MKILKFILQTYETLSHCDLLISIITRSLSSWLMNQTRIKSGVLRNNDRFDKIVAFSTAALRCLSNSTPQRESNSRWQSTWP